MERFINWFNDTAPKGNNPLNYLTRASIAHLCFVFIHPYKDGIGRIGRALTEKSLAQSIKQPTLIALSIMIEKDKKSYYRELEIADKSLEITR